ncbi:MAG: RNA polymerase sigma factor [candidate division WOR-3 bacterium]|nr:RNA polymerase sigma factor [candidate division WOR-3 bacterium]
MYYNSENDETLIQAVKSGDAEAFGPLIERYKIVIYRLVYRMVRNRDDAEDLVQEIFIKAYKGLKDFKTGHKFLPWLSRIAVNHTLNFINKERRVEAQPLEWVVNYDDGKNNPVEMVEQKILKEKIMKAMEQLPEEYRVVLLLRVEEDMSYEEIGQALNIPRGTVMSRLARARQKLKELLEKDKL